MLYRKDITTIAKIKIIGKDISLLYFKNLRLKNLNFETIKYPNITITILKTYAIPL